MQLIADRLRRALTVLGALTCVGTIVSPTGFGASATATALSGQMNDNVSIKLRGRVIPRCEFFGGNDPASAGTVLNGIVKIRRTFQVNCNAPFTVTLTSAHGGLHHRDGHVFPYQASLKIATDSGRMISLACEASNLEPSAGECAGSSGDDTAIGRDAVLTLNWHAPEGAAAGKYTDDLRLSFGLQD